MAWFLLGANAGMVPESLPMTLEDPFFSFFFFLFGTPPVCACCVSDVGPVLPWPFGTAQTFGLVLNTIHYVVVAFFFGCLRFIFFCSFLTEIPGGFVFSRVWLMCIALAYASTRTFFFVLTAGHFRSIVCCHNVNLYT